MTKRAPQLMNPSVPYITSRVPVKARPYLPQRHDDELGPARVHAFVLETRERPEVRLQVLSVLRMHSMNGAETPAAIWAIMLAAVTMLASATGVLGFLGDTVGWFMAVVAVGGCAWFIKMATAAHVRRMTCGVWLAAYEDGLRVEDD